MLKARSPLNGAVQIELQEPQRTLSFFWELLYSWSSCSWSPPEVNFSCFAAFSVLHPVPPWCLLWFWASALAFWIHLGLVSLPWICRVNAGLCLVLVAFTGLLCTPGSGKVRQPWMVSVQALPALLRTSALSSSPAEWWNPQLCLASSVSGRYFLPFFDFLLAISNAADYIKMPGSSYLSSIAFIKWVISSQLPEDDCPCLNWHFI